VIEASGMIAIDYTGSQILQQTITTPKSDFIDVAIVRLAHKRAVVEAEQTGLLAILGPGRIFKSIEDAVRQIGPSAK